MTRLGLTIASLAVMGLLAAAGIGLLVNEVSGDSIGLAAKPLSAAPLAPPQAEEARERRADRRDERRDRREERRKRAAERSERAADDGTAPAVVEPGDDSGGVTSGSDDTGFDDSGSGSSNSGSGSSSSGSGSSGSDDSAEFEDD